MANLTPAPTFDDVYQLERGDPVDAGVNGAGISNRQAQNLANRDQYLKAQQDTHAATLATLGTAATHAATDFATAAQGAKADSAVQPADLVAMQTQLAALDQAIVLKGNWDASSGAFPANTEAGWSYIIDVAGTVDGVDFALGDRLISLVNNASTNTYAASWFKSDGSDKVDSVFGRTGAITSQTGDYTADQITETATNVIMTAAERAKLAALSVGVTWGAAISANVALTAADNGTTRLVTADAIVTLPASSGLPAGWSVELIPDDSATATAHTITLALTGTDTLRGGVTTVKGDCALALTPTAGNFMATGAIS